MKQCVFEIISNDKIAKSTYKMVLRGDTSDFKQPGQFANIKLDGYFLRRPISVCDIRGSELTLIYKVVGQGTEYMSTLAKGRTLDLLTGLGNGFDVQRSGTTPLLIGGGVGVPPLYGLCKELVALGKEPVVIIGFNSKDEVFYEREFKALTERVYVATADGSAGIKGFVTDALKYADGCTYFYTCGPMPMFRAVNASLSIDGEFSFEERMGCGFGACMGCSCHTVGGAKRVCREGPVFRKGEIVWQI